VSIRRISSFQVQRLRLLASRQRLRPLMSSSGLSMQMKQLKLNTLPEEKSNWPYLSNGSAAVLFLKMIATQTVALVTQMTRMTQRRQPQRTTSWSTWSFSKKKTGPGRYTMSSSIYSALSLAIFTCSMHPPEMLSQTKSLQSYTTRFSLFLKVSF
jgi:hypothetical protein